MRLPDEFKNKMERLLEKEEYIRFIEAYNKPRYFGLRVNTLKVSVEEFLRKTPFNLEPIPWVEDGFYYPEDESPGKHPYYYAGLYYIQEPSAMLPAKVLDAKPGERVLDLCAAPGGKTVQIAAGMKGKGIIVANDINSNRVKALVKNIELCGVRNAVVTKDSPEGLSRNFKEYFDRILVDAPCSGEGMFRKDETAVRSWEKYKSSECALVQQDILKYADMMLKPGGYIVYSTCTFSPEENELVVSRFLQERANYKIMEIEKIGGIEGGRPEWANNNKELVKTARLWPHRLKGEGHFVALLRKESGRVAEYKKEYIETNNNRQEIRVFNDFAKDNLNISFEGCFTIKGGNLYWLPEPTPSLDGIKVAKFGWYLGQVTRGRFEPSHSLVVALKREEAKNIIDLDSKSDTVIKYLKGETLLMRGTKGYTAVCVDGYTLGWAKQTGRMLKNLYPKGWRKLS